MKIIQEIPWPRLFAEGVAIIISILLAFWIQAWWEGQKEQEDERTVLQALLDDFNQKKELLDGDQRYVTAIFESATTLLQVATDSDRNLKANEIDELIGDIFWYHVSSQWDSAPMNSLMMGGDIALISNGSVLQKLAALQNTMARIRNNYDADKSFHYNTLVPFLSNNANLAQIVSRIEHSPGDQDNIYEFPEIKVSNVVDHSGLLSRKDFQGLLVAKIDLQLDIIRAIQSEQLQRQLDDITVILETELAK